MNFCAIAS